MIYAIQPLDRVAFELGPLTVYWYGVIIGIGALLGFLIANREANKRGLPKDVFADLLIFAIPIAIVSARLYYVIFRWDYYGEHPGQIVAIWEGGLAIHGGLIGAVITAIVFCKKRGISFWKLADIAAPSIILAQAIGRWGNFMNQEAHGGPVTRDFLESLQLPEFIINQMYIDGTYYHPTFLYESVWNLAGFLLLIFLRRVNLRRGELFLTYVIWYSAGRFFIEGMRTDSLMIGDMLRTAQVISVVLIVTAVALWIYRRQTGLARAHYLDNDGAGVPKKKKAASKQKKHSKKKK
ncbi:phosphatidylglycerol:prolipoprotein diacylglycerol transferase [Alteribacillus persepolensis]|uniref:Phosphatidylglycerol--prolipoprotein diacylglyceryl transferase n=1 Tax=Alteribacillus persepolensis TaxID=568899 RepID=A0A1G8AIG8_9BACI|nr:prolipoprotein diacylglyceryl transferase [Alteribacillus persepolensis]SDH20689.1 phosphatidylglycerol:prolipoprotein diacylglycerol transferase [Alteribacillus persepolensis]